jgi:hypothetical protein
MAAELFLTRLPIARNRFGRQMAVASAVWVMDPKRRAATKAVGRVAGEWAMLRVTSRASEERRQNPNTLLPAALGVTERQLDKLRLRLQAKQEG